VKKSPFRLTPYQVQWLLLVGFVIIAPNGIIGLIRQIRQGTK